MSAIFGIIDRLGHTIDLGACRRMAAALAHRGPDGQATERGPGFLIGHCLLDTAGAGPALGALLADGDFVVSADCRIDNRDELIAALEVPEGAGDTVLVLRAYERWGEDFPTHILGDFAVAIWNKREKTLFCARDHFGIKPFYYCNNHRYVVFATEPAAVLRSGLAEAAVSAERIADFLAGVPAGFDQTSYVAVSRLPPAHGGLMTDGGWRVGAYYTLPRPAILPRADAPAMFRDILTQAVAVRLRGGRAGAMLSGGLDSSSIAVIARRQLVEAGRGALPTFSMVFDETPDLNERPFIEAVLAEGGFAPQFIASSRLAHFAELDTILDEQQDFFLAPNLACTRQVYPRARAAGVRVLLDGHGGDEVAPAGGFRLNELAARGRWLTLWRVLDRRLLQTGERKLQAYWTFVKTYSPVRRVVRLVRGLRRRLGIPGERASQAAGWINPGFAARTGLVARLARRHARPAGSPVTEQAFQYELLTGPLQACAFELLDRTAAAAGIEARFPFWDRRLVEFCLTLEPAEKLNDGWARLILRRAMEGILPPVVQWRRQKFDFKYHLATSIVRDHTELVMRTLDDPAERLGDYIDLGAARAMMERLIADVARPDGYEVQVIFRIMVLAFWLRYRRRLVPANVLA